MSDEDDDRGRKLALLMGGAILVSCAVGGYYFFTNDGAPGYSSTGFDMAEVEARAETAGAYTPRPKPVMSPLPVTGSLPLNLGQQQQAGAPKFKPGVAPEDQAREKEFMQRHGESIRSYMGRMERITMKRYRESPVVRDVDRAFSEMPRYMAIKNRAGGMTPHQFIREAIALPEVRAEIAKRMKDPAVWRESVLMVLETLKEPPPAAVYKEAQRFVLKDPAMIDYVPQFTGNVTSNMGAALKGMPQDRDLTPLQKVLQDVAPNMAAGQGGGTPAVPGQTMRR